jgi:amidase
MIPNTSPFDVTGHPAMNVPCGMSSGLPVGMMIVGRTGDDATVLRAADAYQRQIGG